MLSDEVSKKSLNGAKVTLEQVESTDSVLVANLSPAHTEDVLELYFESSRGGGADVLRVREGLGLHSICTNLHLDSLRHCSSF